MEERYRMALSIWHPHGDENNLFPDAYLPYLNYDE
jgi:hypothetical protein